MPGKFHPISEADVKDLTKIFKEQVRVPKEVDIQGTFCQVWPQAKTALELLNSFIGSIPGVGIFARMSISIVIAAGDAAKSAVCK
jgi:hypothetical protein